MSTIVDKTFAAWCFSLQHTLDSSSGDGGIRFPLGLWWKLILAHIWKTCYGGTSFTHKFTLTVCENMLSTVHVNTVIGLGTNEASNWAVVAPKQPYQSILKHTGICYQLSMWTIYFSVYLLECFFLLKLLESFWEVCFFASLPRVRWDHWYNSHICIHMKLQLASY